MIFAAVGNAKYVHKCLQDQCSNRPQECKQCTQIAEVWGIEAQDDT